MVLFKFLSFIMMTFCFKYLFTNIITVLLLDENGIMEFS